MNALIKPRAARPYIRGKALKERQAKTTAELMAWVELQRFTAERLPKLHAATAPAPRADDPHGELRAQFSHLPPMTAGRAMAAKIVADTKADLIDMEALEKGIHEAMESDFMLEWPELDDMEFRQDLGMV